MSTKQDFLKDVTSLYLAAHDAGWRNPKHRGQWRATLEAYAFPHMGDLAVGDIGTPHVLAALEPIWRVKPETATRVRGRIEAILDYAKVREWRSGENPARWRGHLDHTLPARSKVAKVKHHAALPWPEIGAFMEALRADQGLLHPLEGRLNVDLAPHQHQARSLWFEGFGSSFDGAHSGKGDDLGCHSESHVALSAAAQQGCDFTTSARRSAPRGVS